MTILFKCAFWQDTLEWYYFHNTARFPKCSSKNADLMSCDWFLPSIFLYLQCLMVVYNWTLKVMNLYDLFFNLVWPVDLVFANLSKTSIVSVTSPGVPGECDKLCVTTPLVTTHPGQSILLTASSHTLTKRTLYRFVVEIRVEIWYIIWIAPF